MLILSAASIGRCNARAFGFCSCLESVRCRCTAGMRVWSIYIYVNSEDSR